MLVDESLTLLDSCEPLRIYSLLVDLVSLIEEFTYPRLVPLWILHETVTSVFLHQLGMNVYFRLLKSFFCHQIAHFGCLQFLIGTCQLVLMPVI